jgi:hypothetical protein
MKKKMRKEGKNKQIFFVGLGDKTREIRETHKDKRGIKYLYLVHR